MAKVINCPCGWTARAESDDDLVTQVQQHARDVHNQTATTREQVLAMAPRVGAAPRGRPGHSPACNRT